MKEKKKEADDEEISKMRLLGGKKCRATEEGREIYQQENRMYYGTKKGCMKLMRHTIMETFFLEDLIFLLLIIMRREVRDITRKGRKAIKF